MNVLHKYFKRHDHHHVLKLVDMATGHADYSTYVTGWRWECILCGKTIDEYTESALELLDAGRKSGVVFEWMKERARKKESEK
jgi:hypothetical protein